ncbi:ImmA/IrrE family metallo-endopeptidase [Nocardioides sp. HDW12B]|uniref:helix-turn-helix domain-containing protein n=1 Tax=Nocardioides sp. HDW12B TaxID=2714939 RepID=UPI00140D5F9D|nr:XRE family transcriptional regulator [Nocardioides sp. HDW12B]QIK68009.1 ImmA/IrrE family metallo-endopeptidase [Nocardioides sp. HDW12B]
MPSVMLEDRVRELIARSGHTQETFGAAIGLDSSKLSKALNGRRRFTSLELARIAETCDVTVDWLLSGEEGPAVAARVSAHGSAISLAVGEASNLAESRDNVLHLGGAHDWPKPPTPQSHLWIEQGAELAEFAISHLGVPHVLDTSETFATAIERAFGIDVRVMELDGGCDGLALSTRGGARVLLVAATENPTRQRFTMAHELSHLLCGDDQGLHIDENVMAGSRGESSEVRANAFAAALLMPESALADRFDQPVVTERVFAEAVMDLKVSPSSLAWRLFNLKVLSSERRAQLGAMRTVDCAAVAERMNEYARWVEASSQPRIPVRLVQDLFQAYVEGKTTLRPLANLLHVPVEVLRSAVESAPQPSGADEADDFAP